MAANKGVANRLVKRHAVGLSDKVKDGYVKYIIVNLLKVTRCQGLYNLFSTT